MATITYRDLTTFDDFAGVVELERLIWGPGYDDVVPVPILAITVKRGGILIGAFAAGRLIGFVYSMAALKNGKPTQWSHMLGVIDEYRDAGLGRELKLLQRERTLAMGVELVEWTFDPMQAANAHLNFAKLGVVVEEYEENVYGESSSPLHAGNPTDRFVAEWWVATSHVGQRIHPAEPTGVRTREIAAVPSVNALQPAGEWFECGEVALHLKDSRVLVRIPTGFTDMLARAPELALRWRLATREIFQAYFHRGYRAVDFYLDRANRRGSYLLTSDRTLNSNF